MDAIYKKKELLIFLAVVVALFASKGLLLFPGYSIDDYLHSGLYEWRTQAYLGQGRFTQALLQSITGPFGFYWSEIYFFHTTALLLANAFLITLTVRIVGHPGQSLYALIVAGVLIAVHPFFTELMSFREAAIFIFCFSVLLCVFLYQWKNIDLHQAIHRQPRHYLYCILALTFAIGAYQAALAVAFCLASFATLRQALDLRQKGISGTFRLYMTLYWRGIFPVLAAAVLYLILNELIQAVAHDYIASAPISGDQRGHFVSLTELYGRLPGIWAFLKELLYDGSTLIASPTAKLTLLLTVLSLSVLLRRSFSAAGQTGTVLVVTVLASVFPFAVAGIWWPVFRGLVSLGFVVGCLVVVCLDGKTRVSRLLLSAWLVVAWMLAMHSNMMLYDQIRLNRWDMNKASAIVQDLNRRYGIDFPEPVSLVFEFPHYSHPARLKSSYKDHGLSGFSVVKMQAGVLREATGQNIRIVAPDEKGKTLCRQSDKWPQENAIHKQDGIIYVCL